MTAQAPYESLREVVEALATACRDGLIRNTSDEDTVGVLEDAARAALAALPERAPVSAGGDAVAWVMTYPNQMPAYELVGAPEFVRSKAHAEKIAAGCETHYGKRATYRALYATPPAPPVGADWVMVPRVPDVLALHRIEGVLADMLGNDPEDGDAASIYAAIIAAAPTPAEARGVGDGVRALVAKWRAEANGTDILDCSKSGLMNYCADELEAALAANTRQAQAQGSEGVDLCEVARELERVHVADVISKAAELTAGRETPYWHGYMLACEEIAFRLGFPTPRDTANVGSGGSDNHAQAGGGSNGR